MGTAWTPHQRAAVVWGGLLVFLAMAVLERALTLVFVLNFSVDGPNVTALAVLALLSGLIYPLGLHKRWPHGEGSLGAFVVLCTILLPVILFPGARVALGATVLWHFAATPLLFAMTAVLRRRAGLALALGLTIRLAVLAWTDGLPLYATKVGEFMWLAVAIVWAFLWLQARHAVGSGARRLPNPGPIWAFMFASIVFLGAPALVWSWHQSDPQITHLGALVGTIAGALFAMRGSWAGPARAWEGAGLVAVGAAWVIWGPALAAPGVALACFGTILAADSALDRPRHQRIRRHGLLTALVQFVAVILVFLHIVAGNWAFVGSIGTFLHGHAGLTLWLLVVLAPLADLRRRDWGAAA